MSEFMPHFFPMIVFYFVAAFSPGPNNSMLAASGANFGFMRTMPLMLGVTCGFTALNIGAGLGLERLFALYPPAQTILQYAGGAFILYMAWRIATSGSDTGKAARRPISFLAAFGFQFINPKAILFAASAVANFISPDFDTAPQFIILVVAACIIAFLSVVTWAEFGVLIRKLLYTPLRLRVFNIVMALCLVASLINVFADTLGI